MPKFSIIIPAYNVEQYIPQSFGSILNQTFQDFEVICVDDCSTDNTYDKMKVFADNDPRFILIRHETNRKPGTARNNALENATGQYIVFIDPDDYIVPEALEKLYQTFKKTKADCIWYDAFVIEGDNTSPAGQIIEKEGFYNITPKNISKYGDFVWNKAYRHSALKKIDYKFPDDLMFEDAEFYFKVHTQIKKIYYLPEYLYVYRLTRPNSIVSDCRIGDFPILNVFKIFDNMIDYAKRNGIFEDYKLHLLKVLGESIKLCAKPGWYERVVDKAYDVLKDINFPDDFASK